MRGAAKKKERQDKMDLTKWRELSDTNTSKSSQK